ncbi:hypothetical protein DPMN_150894 [Dreissena polymorpha]|uniref:Uncharacterized protein n=1 Tax=Dreissena polymorpha TaxID=45954 RepID=A0A9D4J2G8_DREPO|nr:hypothetical protein DPMN_150894 [Dreissena polymorpha]
MLVSRTPLVFAVIVLPQDTRRKRGQLAANAAQIMTSRTYRRRHSVGALQGLSTFILR